MEGTITVDKKFILGLHKEVSKECKIKIEKELPELFIKKTGWFRDDTLGMFLAYYENNKRQYGFDVHKRWFDDCVEAELDENDRPATDKEVTEALIKEAKRRGFEKGVNFYSAWNGIKCTFNGLQYIKMRNCLSGDTLGNNCVFQNGEWAEIIEEPTLELTVAQIEEKLGHKVKVIK